MGILDTWLAKFNRAQPSISANETEVAPDNIVDLQLAYQQIEVINRSVELIINGLAEIPFVVEDGPEKKINKLLNVRPNPFEDRQRVFRALFLDFILDGNAFIYYDQEQEGGALYRIPANDVTIITDPKFYIKYYEYIPSSGLPDEDSFFLGKPKKTTGGSNAVIFTRKEIIHVKADSDTSVYRGDSKLKSLERLIELYNAMISFQRQFFKNNAVPGFVLATDNVLSNKIKLRLLEEWKANYSTLFKGARSPAILDGGLKIDKFSDVNFRELDFENSVDRIQQDMAKALGVPYVMLKSGNNANISNNQVLFYLHTILPILDQFASAFTHRFMAKVTADKFSVTALRPDTKAQALYFSTLVNGGIITPNEAREGLRFSIRDKEGEDCDCIRIPQNITGSATNPAVGGRPADEGLSDE